MNALNSLYDQLFFGTASQARKAIEAATKKKKFIFVSFAYFAALKMTGWYEGREPDDYKNALMKSDFLLPDGIALRLLYYRYKHQEVSALKMLFAYRYYASLSVGNLNGTDFLPQFLTHLESKKDYRLVLYGTFPEVVEKAAKYAKKAFKIETVFQDGYTLFDMKLLSADKTNILLVGMWAPRQELWIMEHQKLLSKQGRVIAFAIGGLLDFWGGRERRAPQIVRKFSLEWLWRLITKPQKNAKKVATSLLFFVELFKQKISG